jgi:hypothetical protein
MERHDIHTEFWWGNLLKNNHLEDQEGEGKKILKWKFCIREVDCEDSRRMKLTRIVSSGGLL